MKNLDFEKGRFYQELKTEWSFHRITGFVCLVMSFVQFFSVWSWSNKAWTFLGLFLFGMISLSLAREEYKDIKKYEKRYK